MTHIINRATFDERSGTFSAVYLVSYGGAAVPNLLVGLFAGSTPVMDVMYCYVVFVFAMAVILFALTARGYEDAPARDAGIPEERIPGSGPRAAFSMIGI